MTSLPGKFTEADYNAYVDVLNFLATEARFGDGPPKLAYCMKVTKQFSLLQAISNKIHANIAEIKEVQQTKKSDEPTPEADVNDDTSS